MVTVVPIDWPVAIFLRLIEQACLTRPIPHRRSRAEVPIVVGLAVQRGNRLVVDSRLNGGSGRPHR
jgi:hypothetical protein